MTTREDVRRSHRWQTGRSGFSDISKVSRSQIFHFRTAETPGETMTADMKGRKYFGCICSFTCRRSVCSLPSCPGGPASPTLLPGERWTACSVDRSSARPVRTINDREQVGFKHLLFASRIPAPPVASEAVHPYSTSANGYRQIHNNIIPTNVCREASNSVLS